MGNDITNKRKRKSTADVSSALAALKKSKSKSQDPPPKKARKEASSEDEEEEQDDDVEEDLEEDEGDDVEQTNGHGGDDDDDDGDEEANGEDLPTDSTPVLPLGTNAESFEELKLSEKTMEAIKEMGFTKMTAIQKTVRIRCLPALSSATANLTLPRPSLLCSLARMFSVPPRPVQERLLPS